MNEQLDKEPSEEVYFSKKFFLFDKFIEKRAIFLSNSLITSQISNNLKNMVNVDIVASKSTIFLNCYKISSPTPHQNIIYRLSIIEVNHYEQNIDILTKKTQIYSSPNLMLDFSHSEKDHLLIFENLDGQKLRLDMVYKYFDKRQFFKAIDISNSQIENRLEPEAWNNEIEDNISTYPFQESVLDGQILLKEYRVEDMGYLLFEIVYSGDDPMMIELEYSNSDPRVSILGSERKKFKIVPTQSGKLNVELRPRFKEILVVCKQISDEEINSVVDRGGSFTPNFKILR